MAIVKATNHVECPPKDRHLRSTLICVPWFSPHLGRVSGCGVWSVGGGVAEIAAASSIAGARADVAYCVHALARRLTKTRNWIVSTVHLLCQWRNFPFIRYGWCFMVCCDCFSSSDFVMLLNNRAVAYGSWNLCSIPYKIYQYYCIRSTLESWVQN